MKNLNRISKTVLLALSMLYYIDNSSAQTISNHFFGENAWMPPAIGTIILNGKLNQNWGKIKSSKAAVIRYGGIAGDKDKPTNAQYIAIIDSIRANGMEPIIQVPFYNYRYTAQQAADIVTYINITKGRNIRYWIIGNEPDLSYSFTTAAQIAGYFKPFASAMKNVDPSILIIGPECAWYNQSIINGLTTPNGPDDITGKDANGRYYLDIISFHTYPFNGTQTRAQVISKLTSAGSLQDNLALLNTRVASCNSTHNRTGATALKTAITEANVNWQNSTSDNLSGTGANSFLGGQFIAEMMGIGMKRGLDFINIWSVVEGNSIVNNIGYIDPSTGNKKPSYHHFKLMAENFKGTVATCTTNQSNVKSFGSQDAQQISVIIMNEDISINHNYTVRLNTAAIAGTSSLKINVNAGLPAEFTGTLSNQSTILLIFNSQGSIVKKYEYSLQGHAFANLPPTLTEFPPVLLPIELLSFTGKTDGRKNLLEWETASETNNDYFTIEKQVKGETFSPIDKIDGEGNSTAYNRYHSYDNEPVNGISYYRLKQTDFNGAFTYSEVISIENRFSTAIINNIYPNPTSGEVRIDLHMNRGGHCHVRITDVIGRLVFQEIQNIPEGDSSIAINMENVPNGIYAVTILDEQGNYPIPIKLVKH